MVSETKDRFRQFLLRFIDEEADETSGGYDSSRPLYLQKLEEVIKNI